MHNCFSRVYCQITHYLFKNSFSRKMTLTFLGVTMIPLIIISLVFFRINSNTSYEKVANATSLANQQLVQQIESRFTQMENVADTLQSYMLTYPTRGETMSTEEISTFSTIRTNVLTLINTFEFQNICIFLDSDLIFNQEGLLFYPLDRLSEFNINVDELTLSNSESTWLFVQDQNYPIMLNKLLSNQNTSIDAINCIRMQQNISGSGLRYLFFISLDVTEFVDLLESSFPDSEVAGCLMDCNREVVISSGSESIQEEILQMLQRKPELSNTSGSFRSSDALYYINVLSNQFLYVTRVSQQYIQDDAALYLRTLLLVLVCIIPLAILIVMLLTRNFTRRITLLSRATEHVNFKDENAFSVCKVDYIAEKAEQNWDEVDKLAATYNHMLDTLQKDIQHITALKAQEESLKYQLLQSLINPHFLYNILDSALACNDIGKPELANKLIMDLSRFYRMTLRKSNELITIRDELEIARLYMELESICRGGNFTWRIDLDDEIDNFMICKFTLQPFIENSILHGMQGNHRQLHINTEIRYGEDDTILIYIRDNGNGIAPEKLAELKDSLKSGAINTSRHFGICNVSARISSELFGHGIVEIDSEYGVGTTVKIEFLQILP